MSLAKYWIIIVPDVASADKATPDSTMASGDKRFLWLRNKMSHVEAKAPKKANMFTPQGKPAKKFSFLPLGPKPKMTRATAAPNAAP